MSGIHAGILGCFQRTSSVFPRIPGQSSLSTSPWTSETIAIFTADQGARFLRKAYYANPLRLPRFVDACDAPATTC
jgi:hypothetical protein